MFAKKDPTAVNPHLLTFQYAVIQGTYWIAVCAVTSFAMVLLLSFGFTNSQVGYCTATGSILSVIFQPILGNIADRSKKITVKHLMMITIGIACISYFLLSILPKVFGLIVVLFVFTSATLSITSSLINALSVYYINRDIKLNFGLARGCGSASYAVASSLLGTLTATYGNLPLYVCAVGILIVMLVFLLWAPTLKEAISESKEAKNADASEPQKKESFLDFFKNYKFLSLAMLGFAFLFASHCLNSNYMLQIVRSVGGDNSHMGLAMSISAISEFPAMLGFALLRKRFKCSTLMMVSSIFFSLKTFGYLISGNVTMIYLTSVLQMLAYALYLPASVYFVNMTMRPEDVFKGQTYMASSTLIGMIAANLLGGMLIDYGSVQLMKIVSMCLSLLGTVIVLPTIYLSAKGKE